MTAKLGAAGTGAKFSPLEVGWVHSYWPGGPAFKAEGYPDGQVMNDGETIPDEAGTRDLTSDSGAAETTLTYVASSNVNSKPAIRGADTSGDHPPFSSPSFSPRIGVDPSDGFYASATGWSMVVIWNQGPMTNNEYGNVIEDKTSNTWFEMKLRASTNSLNFRLSSYLYAASIGWASGDTIAVMTKTQSNLHYVDVNGTNYVNIARAGFSLSGVQLFMRSTTAYPFSGDLAFVGIYEGDCTGDPAWSDFETWASDELGATI